MSRNILTKEVKEQMNNRWRRIAKLDISSFEGYAKTESSIMVFNSVFWGTVALDNHTECRTSSFRKGNK